MPQHPNLAFPVPNNCRRQSEKHRNPGQQPLGVIAIDPGRLVILGNLIADDPARAVHSQRSVVAAVEKRDAVLVPPPWRRTYAGNNDVVSPAVSRTSPTQMFISAVAEALQRPNGRKATARYD